MELYDARVDDTVGSLVLPWFTVNNTNPNATQLATVKVIFGESDGEGKIKVKTTLRRFK